MHARPIQTASISYHGTGKEPMNTILDDIPLASVAFVIVAIAGAIIAIIHPDTLSFSGYVRDIGIAAAGLGVLGIARAQSGKGK